MLFDSAVPIVNQYGDALAGQDHRRHHQPLQRQRHGLAIPDDTSIAQMVAEAAPASAHVVKAFNTLFRDVLAAGGPLDVFIAGDDAQAKASVSAFIESLGLRPQDTGDLSMAHWLEGAGLVLGRSRPPRRGQLRLRPRRTDSPAEPHPRASPSRERTGRCAPSKWLMNH